MIIDSTYAFVSYDFEPKVSVNDYILGKNRDQFVSLKQLQNEVDKKLSLLPKEIINLLENTNWEIIITNKTEVDKDYTKAQLLELYGTTEVEIFGNTNPCLQRVQIEATPRALNFSLLHEIGHIVDFLLNDFSSTKEWKEKYKKFEKLTTSLPFYGSNEVEFFANCFAVYFEDRKCFSTTQIEEKCGANETRRVNMSSIEDIISNIVRILPLLDKSQLRDEPLKEIPQSNNMIDEKVSSNPSNLYLDVDAILNDKKVQSIMETINKSDPTSYCY